MYTTGSCDAGGWTYISVRDSWSNENFLETTICSESGKRRFRVAATHQDCSLGWTESRRGCRYNIIRLRQKFNVLLWQHGCNVTVRASKLFVWQVTMEGDTLIYDQHGLYGQCNPPQIIISLNNLKQTI